MRIFRLRWSRLGAIGRTVNVRGPGDGGVGRHVPGEFARWLRRIPGGRSDAAPGTDGSDVRQIHVAPRCRHPPAGCDRVVGRLGPRPEGVRQRGTVRNGGPERFVAAEGLVRPGIDRIRAPRRARATYPGGPEARDAGLLAGPLVRSSERAATAREPLRERVPPRPPAWRRPAEHPDRAKLFGAGWDGAAGSLSTG